MLRKDRHALLVERCPEVHRLAADQYELAAEVCDSGEDRPNRRVVEFRHSSGFVPRRLMNTFRASTSPFSRLSCSRLFSPDSSARASSALERRFSAALSFGSNGSPPIIS